MSVCVCVIHVHGDCICVSQDQLVCVIAELVQSYAEQMGTGWRPLFGALRAVRFATAVTASAAGGLGERVSSDSSSTALELALGMSQDDGDCS